MVDLPSESAGVLHVLVNNVGTNVRKATVEYTEADVQALLNTNLASAFHLSQLCHPFLKAAGTSCIVFNSSVGGGPLAMKSGSVYAMTKGAQPCTATPFVCTPQVQLLQRQDIRVK